MNVLEFNIVRREGGEIVLVSLQGGEGGIVLDFILSESAYSAMGPLVTLLPDLTHTQLMWEHRKSQRMNSSVAGQ